MGNCTSSTKVKDDVPAKKAEPVNGAKHTPAEPKSVPTVPAAEPTRTPNPNVKVDFGTPDVHPVGEPLERKWSKPPSFKSQASEGQLREGVYIPSSGFKTEELRKQMAEFYNMPEEEVEKAIDFAESEEYVDIYCFTFCITGGPMEPTAFKVAGLQGMDKEAILQWATAPGNEDVRVLNAEEQQRQRKAKELFLVNQALQPEYEESEAQPEDIEDLTEAYRVRFEADTQGMDLEEVLEYFGVPEVSKVAIHKHLHPARGSANASQDELARRRAAHPIALDKFDQQHQ